MAGKAERIRNFCTSFPNSPGCPWPSSPRFLPPPVNPCVAAAARPLSIGTTKCDTYTYYINGYPSTTNPDNYITEHVVTESIYPDPYYIGFRNVSVAKIFSDSGFTNQVGQAVLNATATYDVPLPVAGGVIPGEGGTSSSACVTSNTATQFYDISLDPTTSTNYLKASVNVVFTYHLVSTNTGTAYPGSFKTKSISTGQQLVDNNIVVYSSVEIIGSPVPTKVINKIVLTGCASK